MTEAQIRKAALQKVVRSNDQVRLAAWRLRRGFGSYDTEAEGWEDVVRWLTGSIESLQTAAEIAQRAARDARAREAS